MSNRERCWHLAVSNCNSTKVGTIYIYISILQSAFLVLSEDVVQSAFKRKMNIPVSKQAFAGMGANERNKRSVDIIWVAIDQSVD